MSLERIGEIRKELKSLGYYDFQIRDMVEECCGSRDLKAIRPSQMQDLIDFLEERLKFARKCMDID